MVSFLSVFLTILASFPHIISYFSREPDATGPYYEAIRGTTFICILAVLNAYFLDPKWDEDGIPIEGRFTRSTHHKKSHLIGAIIYSKCYIAPFSALAMAVACNLLHTDPSHCQFFLPIVLLIVCLLLVMYVVEGFFVYRKLSRNSNVVSKVLRKYKNRYST